MLLGPSPPPHPRGPLKLFIGEVTVQSRHEPHQLLALLVEEPGQGWLAPTRPRGCWRMSGGGMW